MSAQNRQNQSFDLIKVQAPVENQFGNFGALGFCIFLAASAKLKKEFLGRHGRRHLAGEHGLARAVAVDSAALLIENPNGTAHGLEHARVEGPDVPYPIQQLRTRHFLGQDDLHRLQERQVS